MTALAKEADAARQTGDPQAIAEANKRLIAFSLRLMGKLRLLESAYPQAADLYAESLMFQELPDTRVDLAIAELSDDRPDEAIVQANQALAADPQNRRAEVVLGRALVAKEEFAKAVPVLTRAVETKPDPILNYLLATSLLGTKNPRDKQRAQEIFHSMIHTGDGNAAQHLAFGQAYRTAGDMSDAVKEFRRAIEIDPRTPYAHYFLGLSLLVNNDWKPTPEAEREFKEELRYHPHEFLANYLLGFLLSGDRQYESANKYLMAAVEVNSGLPEPWLYLGLNAYAQGDMPRAEEMLRKAIILTGEDDARSNYQIRRAYINMGRILANSHRQAEADKYLAKARELQNKMMAGDQQNVALWLKTSGQGPVAWMVALDKKRASPASPDSGESTDPFARVGASVISNAHLTREQLAAANAQENSLRLALAQSLSDLATSEAVRGDYPTALAHYQEAAHWNATIPGLAKNLGQCAFRGKNYTEAVHWLAQDLKQDPNASPAIRAILGMAYYATDKYTDAVNTFSPLGDVGMKDPAVGYLWAVSLTKLNDFKKASAVLAQYEEGNLSNESLLLVGQLWMQMADYGRAIATFHRALQADPSLPKAHYYAGEADIHWEHWPDAEKEFQAELDLVPGEVDAMYDLGFVDLQQSKPAEAQKLFEQVVAANPDYANAQYELGKMLLQQGKIGDAVAHLEIATRLNPDAAYMHYQLQAAYRKEGRKADAYRELKIYSALKANSRPKIAPSEGSHP